MDQQSKTEVRDGMRIDWDVPIAMADGVQLRADIFRPDRAGKFAVLLTYGPYGKGLAFQQGYKTAWDNMVRDHPEVAEGSTNKYQNWEVVDPEKWVPEDYVCVRVDSRGAGRSPGYMEIWSPNETKDIYECIEWAAVQPWSNGKIGMNGISYLAMNQWAVAALQPPHLAAICPWEGSADMYREVSHHGGIMSCFVPNWFPMQVTTVQHGLGTRGPKSAVTGELVCGPETLSEAELVKNREDHPAMVRKHEMFNDFWKPRLPDWSKVTVPMLSAANWGGQGLHPRGNYEGFTQSASKEKWLECHGLEHWTHFYTDYGRKLQLKFFDYYLKGKKNGWNKTPPVLLQVRHVDKFVQRAENEWPLKRTKWTKLFIDTANLTLGSRAPAKNGKLTYRGMSDGVTFMLPPQEKDVEITGPLAMKLFVSSSTKDADLFIVVRLFTPDMKEITFQGTLDPHTPIAQGWQRASHRKLDKKLSKPYRPYLTHDEKQLLKPGEIVELNIEIIPTCIVVPAGYRLAVTVRGKDYEYAGEPGYLSNMKYPLRGCGPFLHDDPVDRPARIFDGNVTLYAGPKHPSHLLLPVIPAKKGK